MSRYYLIEVAGRVVYACTDPLRFTREASKYAGISNAKLILPNKGQMSEPEKLNALLYKEF